MLREKMTITEQNYKSWLRTCTRKYKWLEVANLCKMPHENNEPFWVKDFKDKLALKKFKFN